MTEAALAEDPLVRRWFQSAHLDDDPQEEKDQRLRLLALFCDHTGKSPEELVKGLLRTTKEGDTAISSKRRGGMNGTIEEFIDQQGFTRRDAGGNGKVLLSFPGHNWSFLPGPALRGSSLSPTVPPPP